MATNTTQLNRSTPIYTIETRNTMTSIPIHGGESIIDRSLRYKVLSNALYIPKNRTSWYDNDANWGIFDGDKLDIDTAYIRGPGENTVGQSWIKPDLKQSIQFLEGVYVYGGTIQPHYGHFLFDGIARYWHNERSFKFIVQGPTTVEDWFSYKPIPEIFNTLGLNKESFLRPDYPTFIENLIVPEPSIRETHSVHEEYGHMGTRIGHKFVPDPKPGGPPVYFSKRELTRGIWAAENEEEIEDRLLKAGVVIMHPQKLSLQEQIRIFSERLVIGLEGSAFHTAALAPVQTRSIIIVKFCHAISNFTLIDKIKHNNVIYVTDGKSFEKIGRVGDIDAMYRIPDAKSVAENVLKAIDKIF